MYLINIAFIASEIVIGIVIMRRFSATQSAAFYRRTAPLIDKKFKRKFEALKTRKTATGREIAIGMRSHVPGENDVITDQIFE